MNSCLNSHEKDEWGFDSKNSFTKQEGSGNNWAYGYNMHGPNVRESLLEIMRNLVEEIDFCEGLVFF